MPSPERYDLLTKLRETRHELLEILAARADTEESAMVPTKPGEGGEAEWSLKQQLAHLAESERLWADWARRAALGDADVGPKGHPPDGQISGTQYTAHSHSLVSLIRQVDDARASSLEVIAGIPDAAFTRTGRTPSGDLTVLQMLRGLYRHDRMHSDQIAGRESSFQPRVALA